MLNPTLIHPLPPPRSAKARLWLVLASSAALPLMVIGCPTTPVGDTPTGMDSDGGMPGDSGAVTGRIVSLTTNRTFSVGGPEVSVTYAVTGTPDSISGFHVPVADNSPGAEPIDVRFIVATNLPATGSNTRFGFDPGEAGVGFFRVGILLTVGGEQREALSDGIIQVVALPDPCFTQPCQPVTGADPATEVFTSCGGILCARINEVVQGADVPIGFESRIPVGDIQWRVFYFNLAASDSRTDPPDLLGTQIAVGLGNLGSATFMTVDLVPGDYELGVSATDTGRSIAGTVATGDLDRIVTRLGPVVRIVDGSSTTP